MNRYTLSMFTITLICIGVGALALFLFLLAILDGCSEKRRTGSIAPSGAPGADVELGSKPPTAPPDECIAPTGSIAPPGARPADECRLRKFDYKQLEEATSGFSEENFVGKGGFGDVYKGKLLVDGPADVAVKRLTTEPLRGNKQFMAEIQSIGRIRHPNLVRLIGYCDEAQNKLLVYEFIPNNSLRSHLHGTKSPTITWNNRLKIAIGTAKGLTFLHEHCKPRFIHRDIKTANVLLHRDFEPTIADFGLAKLFPDSATHVTTTCSKGTHGYLAPECFTSYHLTRSSDVYAFGVLLMELITGNLPNANGFLAFRARPQLITALKDGKYDAIVDPKLKTDYNHVEMKRMMQCAVACTRKKPQDRPQMSKIVEDLQGGTNSPNI